MDNSDASDQPDHNLKQWLDEQLSALDGIVDLSLSQQTPKIGPRPPRTVHFAYEPSQQQTRPLRGLVASARNADPSIGQRAAQNAEAGPSSPLRLPRLGISRRGAISGPSGPPATRSRADRHQQDRQPGADPDPLRSLDDVDFADLPGLVDLNETAAQGDVGGGLLSGMNSSETVQEAFPLALGQMTIMIFPLTAERATDQEVASMSATGLDMMTFRGQRNAPLLDLMGPARPWTQHNGVSSSSQTPDALHPGNTTHIGDSGPLLSREGSIDRDSQMEPAEPELASVRVRRGTLPVTATWDQLNTRNITALFDCVGLTGKDDFVSLSEGDTVRVVGQCGSSTVLVYQEGRGFMGFPRQYVVANQYRIHLPASDGPGLILRWGFITKQPLWGLN